MEERIENGGGTQLPCRNLLFGKYQFGRLLGQGTFAKVYYAKNLLTDDPVAIKVLHKDQVRKEGLIEQIKREISVMHLVKHPNVVELKEVMANKSKIFFVMEYVKGGELFAKVLKGKLPESDARRYFQQLISAVDFCHSRGVSHRDLKPENLLLDESGNLKISDFGLSALPEQNWHDGLLHTQCGTPAYVAPEVLRKRGYDGAKADLWSCGVILYVLLAGFLPFQDENIMNMYRKVFKAEFEFPLWFSGDVLHLLVKLLVTDPKKRITIDKIMMVPWFKKGFTRPTSCESLSPFPDSAVMEALKSESETPTPEFFNAFELISSMSSGFDLSGFFESKKRAGSMFTSKCSAITALSKLEGLAKSFKFQVTKVKDFKIKMQRSEPGRLGPLAVTAEIFELTPDFAVVEFDKWSGDALEYLEFCEDLRPALRDIIWAWQGEEEEEEEGRVSQLKHQKKKKKHGHREAQAAAA